jgi:nucleoside 2-deoxyribosyltransferase
MFNLIVAGGNWESTGSAEISSNRFFEYTNKAISNQFRQIERDCIYFEYFLDSNVPPLKNSMISDNKDVFDMINFEFWRNHWAVKNVDLFRSLFRIKPLPRQRPSVFKISEYENIEPRQASAMMPFDAAFNPVYKSIQQAAKNVDFDCKRADDIWENAEIMQDVVDLIDRSRIVICDCTGRNSNVFYEIGIAHTLGREVILITQNKDDIPFDLRHLRYIYYCNNDEGHLALTKALQNRMERVPG